MRVSDLFKKKGFTGLFVSQATGAFNDNAMKMIIIGMVLATTPKSEHDSHLALVNALLIAPFVFLAPIAGWFSDRFSKRSVLIGFKATEFLILMVAGAAVYTGSLWFLLLLLFLMGAQSSFYSPAKYGILKELAGEKMLGQANGVTEMGTIAAIIFGTVGGSLMFDTFVGSSPVMPVAILGIFSLAGLFASFSIENVPSGSRDSFTVGEFFRNIAEMNRNRVLRLTVTGIAYFWFSAMLLNLLLILFGTQVMGLKTVTEASLLFLYLSVGVAGGSFFAGKASRFSVELGLIPTGSIGMGIACAALPFLAGSYRLVVLDLILLGVSGGLFLVPLNTLLQTASGDDKRGRYIAITNMVTNVGMLLSSAALAFFSSYMGLTPGKIMLILGVFSFAVSGYVFYLLPEAFLSFSLGAITHTVYRIRAVNSEVVPETGPVLLTPNHMSFVDGLLLRYSVPQRKIRFVVYRSFFDKPFIGWLLRTAGCIPISSGGSKDAIIKVSEALNNGEAVCIFPEGSLTRIGFLLPFKKGIELILRKSPEDTAVIPVCLDKVWGSIFSFKGNRFFKKLPERLPYPVTVMFGQPVNRDVKAFELRQRVSELSTEAFMMRKEEFRSLPVHFIRSAKRFMFRKAVVDISEKPLTYLNLLTASILVSRRINRMSGDERMIGLMLPASSAGAIANIAVGLSGKTSVNLNFRAGEDSISKAMTKCEMKTILTSKIFAKKAGLKEMDEFVYMEDVMKEIGGLEKALIMAAAALLPSFLLTKLFCKCAGKPEGIATVIFSSGSTGDPKGVMLSHANIISNGEMATQVLHFDRSDTMLGSLPLFHSFGYSITLWLPLLKGIFTVFVPDPLDAKKVGAMAEKYRATIILGTPTFYSLYSRGCTKDQFKSIRIAISGAERLRESVAKEFADKFRINLLEGYGATEMSPVISCNAPDYSCEGGVQEGTRCGSAGLPLPGVSLRVVDPNDYDRELPPGEEGMLLVNGPNRMAGYLGDEKRTAVVLHNGWYITGDIGKIDEDGFVHIVGRLSRFSKIAGEMVPHVHVEEMLNKSLGFDEPVAMVTAVKDESKGERLVVLHLPQASPLMDQKTVAEKLKEAGLPNLWIPKEFYEVESFPMLGSGKLDLKGLSDMAQRMTAGIS